MEGCFSELLGRGGLTGPGNMGGLFLRVRRGINSTGPAPLPARRRVQTRRGGGGLREFLKGLWGPGGVYEALYRLGEQIGGVGGGAWGLWRLI